MATPRLDREWSRAWAKRLARAHPDAGGDPETFLKLQLQREQELPGHVRCKHCGRAVPQHSRNKIQMHCNQWCAAQTNGKRQRKPRRIPDGESIGGKRLSKRAKLHDALFAHGLAVTEAAAFAGLHVRTARQWADRWNLERTSNGEQVPDRAGDRDAVDGAGIAAGA
jgi:hypothetical protein